MANPVPTIPPLSSISDPNTRAVLQSIVDAWRIRNGEIGTGDEKFLTVADFTAGAAGGSFGSGGSGGNSPSSKAVKSVAAIIQKLSDQIQQSRIWKLLDERITLIDTPEWFAGKFGAAIRTEQVLRESQDSAIAQEITTAVTNINGNIALVQNSVTAVSDQAGATASSVTQLQTTVGGVSSAAQQALSLAQTVDGTVKGTWSVKFDVNGYVAGVALGVEQKGGSPPKSNFVVRADTFAVGSPGAQDTVPFFVQNGVTYIKTAMIQDASVDTLKIAGNAVTVPVYASASATVYGNSGYQTVLSFYVTLAQAGGILASASWLMGSSAPGWWGGKIVIAGQIVADTSTSNNTMNNAAVSGGGFFSAGTHLVELQWYGQSGVMQVGNRSMFAIGAMR